MNELNELFEKYTVSLEKSNSYLKDFLNNFPELDLSGNILGELSKDKLKRLEFIASKLELNNKEASMMKEVFDYYYRNSDLNLSDLIVQDESYENFIQFIKNIYLKALKYKKDVTLKVEKEQEKYRKLLNNIKCVKELMQSEAEINMDSLVNYLKDLPLTREAILEITTIALDNNLKLYQKLKITKEVEDETEKVDTEEMVVDSDFDYQNALNIYPMKLTEFINKLERDGNYQGEKYETLAKLVVLRDKLMEIKQDYEFSMEDPEYFKNDIPEILIRIRRLITDIDMTIDTYENSMPDEEMETENTEYFRNLIILNSSMKDLSMFRSSECSSVISKNLGKLLHSLRYDEVVYGMPFTVNVGTNFPVNVLKASRSVGGSPRVFYQVVNNKVVILMLGIEGKNDFSYFKQGLEARLRDQEYNILINAIRLGAVKPEEVSHYNSEMTNKTYLDSLLEYYKKQEIEFLNRFETECSTKTVNMR